MGVQSPHERSADRPITASPNGPGEGSRPDAHRPRQTGTIRTERRPADQRSDAAEHGGPHARRHEPRHDPVRREHQLGHSRGPLRRARARDAPGTSPDRPMTRVPPSVGLVPFRSDGLCSTANDAHAPLTGCAGLSSPARVAVTNPPARATSDRATGARLTFDHLGLSADLLRAVADEGYTEPTAHPGQGHPLVLAGRDVLRRPRPGPARPPPSRCRSSNGSRTRRTRASRQRAARSGR